MSYLTYNGKRVISNNKYVTGIGAGQIYLADFNNDGVRFTSEDIPEISGDMKLTFKMYLDVSMNYSNRIIYFEGNNNDWVGMSIVDSSIFISTSSGFPTYYTVYPLLPSYAQNILNIEIRKNPYADGNAKYYPYHFMINDVSVQGINGFVTSSSKTEGNGIGSGFSTIGTASFPNRMDKGTLWDIKITEVSTGLDLHYWKGYGNTAGDWEDLIGTIDVSAIDAMGTRTVPGFIPS